MNLDERAITRGRSKRCCVAGEMRPSIPDLPDSAAVASRIGMWWLVLTLN